MTDEITFVSKSTVKLVSTMGTDDDVCHAAWVSNYGDNHKKAPQRSTTKYNYETREYEPAKEWVEWEKQTQGLINFLYRERHMSPFEHATMKFYIETPIFVTREFMRHRTWSYNEMSSRYTVLPGRMFMIPDNRPLIQSGKIGAYRFEPGTDEQYGKVYAETSISYSRAWQSYNSMLDAGVAREVARNVLPVGTMTQFYATANLRNVMQFLMLRNDPSALKEIRDVAVEIEKHFEEKFPKVYNAYIQYDWRNAALDLKDKDETIKILEDRVKELSSRLTK